MKTRLLKTTAVLIAVVISSFTNALCFEWQSTIVSNYPNPFDSRSQNTTIVYNAGYNSDVTVKIYDLFGNLVREYNQVKTNGENQIEWDGTDSDGSKVAKGGYICAIEILNGMSKSIATRKIGVIH
jgi:flagellar hook assembly protein FlgD